MGKWIGGIVAVAVVVVFLYFTYRTPGDPNVVKPEDLIEKSPEAESSDTLGLDTTIAPEAASTRPMFNNPPPLTVKSTDKYQATLSTTEGDIVIDLLADKTPKTVNNFVFLSQNKFYDETIFHRVINGFMIQGGDPKGDGTGGPGYSFDDEPFEGEYTRGTVAMANAGPDTNGSQFFIMHADYPLPKNYVIFGKVSSGIEVVDKIATAEVAESRGEKSKPVTPVKIESIEIVKK